MNKQVWNAMERGPDSCGCIYHHPSRLARDNSTMDKHAFQRVPDAWKAKARPVPPGTSLAPAGTVDRQRQGPPTDDEGLQHACHRGSPEMEAGVTDQHTPQPGRTAEQALATTRPSSAARMRRLRERRKAGAVVMRLLIPAQVAADLLTLGCLSPSAS